MQDPLIQFQTIFTYDPNQILAFTRGDKYVALLLRNGQIGVCATLGATISSDPMILLSPHLAKTDHRIIFNAYVNASANYTDHDLPMVDVFDNEDFSLKSHIVMVGYFAPLVSKFLEQKLPLTVFDRVKKDEILAPLETLPNELQNADSVILTSTSLSNGTFLDTIQRTSPQASTLLLGPSTPLHPMLFTYPGVSALYGMTFDLYDFDLLRIIAEGAGTRTFGSRGKKRYLCSA